MTQTSFPFENIDTTETQFSQMFRTLNRGVNGTPDGGELEVTAGTGLAVDVAAGQAMVRGHFYISTAVEELSLATADATNDRIDTIALELDPTANSIVLVVVEGTPAGSPAAPTLTQTDAGVYQLPLANVLVPATAGVPGTISDRREFMGSKVGVWDTDGRPVDPAPGQIGYNTTEESWEGYDPIADDWSPIGGGGATIVNTDGDPGQTIYVGSIDPDGTYTLVAGDVWIEVP